MVGSGDWLRWQKLLLYISRGDVGLVRPKTYTLWGPSLRKSMQKYMQTLQKDMNHVNTFAGAVSMALKKNFLYAHAPYSEE